MLKARVVAVKELLTPPLGPRAGLKEGAGDAIYKKTSPGEHPAEETLAAQPQSFDAAAGDHDAQMARSPRRPSDSRFQPKLHRAHV